MQPAQEALAPGHATRHLPRAVLAQVGAAAPAPPQPALAPAVAAQAAHAAARAARHGAAAVLERAVAAARAAAGDAAVAGRVEGREGDALAAVVAGEGALRGEVGVPVCVGGWGLAGGGRGSEVWVRRAAVAAGGGAGPGAVPGLGAVVAGGVRAAEEGWCRAQGGLRLRVPVEHFSDARPAEAAPPGSCVELGERHPRGEQLQPWVSVHMYGRGEEGGCE
jgi:hypothetical protein